MHLAIDWNWLLHADELLFFIWLVVWLVGEIISLVNRVGK